jgi:hypothetical protein
MHRKLILATMFSLTAGLAAHAQDSAASAPASGAADTTAPASSSAAALKTGMVVKDTTGAMVGTITQVGQTPDGRAAAVINVDGQPINILASNLTVDPSGTAATSAYTKAQLQASAKPAG